MNAKALIIIMGVFLIVPVSNAADVTDFAMEMLSPQTSLMSVGLEPDVEYMWADLQPMNASVYAGGKMYHKGWYDRDDAYRESFVTVVAVHVPSKVPGFDTIDDAIDSDVRIRISREGVPFAECILAVEPVTSRSAVYFRVDLAAIWGDVKPNKGICDINLQKDGTQVGIPVLSYLDLITTYVRGKPYREFEFLKGFCY